MSAGALAVRSGGRSRLGPGACQWFDRLQPVGTGTRAGTGDTKTPMLANFIAYWLIGLPVGDVLCFRAGWGAVGVWIGLCGGLMIIGSALLLAWHRRKLPT